jgi:hypothetical protein
MQNKIIQAFSVSIRSNWYSSIKHVHLFSCIFHYPLYI